MKIIEKHSEIYGLNLFCHDDYIYKASVSQNKIWDEEIVEEILKHHKENTEILDIGSNIGLITIGLLVKSKIPIQKIHCFECHPENIPLLYKNTKNFTNVNIYPFALSDKQELCQMTTLPYNMGCNFIYKSLDLNHQKDYDYKELFNSDGHEKNNQSFIVGVSLDSIKYNFKNNISVIKIDVEGYELKVLMGAKELIEEHRPVVIVEIFEKIHLNQVVGFFNLVKYASFKKVQNNNYYNEDYIFYPI